MNLGSDLSGAERNTETEKQVTLCIGDHVCISVSISAPDTSEIQRVFITKHRFCQYTGNDRNLSFTCKLYQFPLTGRAVYTMSQHDHRTCRCFECCQNRISSLLRLCSICVDILKCHIINRIFYFASLNIHWKVNKNRTSASCGCNVICFI